jgi:predicted nucleic acid-binding protein
VILADTSVWIDHLRRGNARLTGLLEAGEVSCHPFVVGELAGGTLRNRREVLSLLGELPAGATATHEEAMVFREARRLMGRGLGYVNLYLLASASLDRGALWTLDKRLAMVAESIGLAA